MYLPITGLQSLVVLVRGRVVIGIFDGGQVIFIFVRALPDIDEHFRVVG